MTDSEMTVLDAVQTLRGLAASIEVDNGGYRDKLTAIADWIECKFTRLLADAVLKVQVPPWTETETVRAQAQTIANLQSDIAYLRACLAHTQFALSEEIERNEARERGERSHV